MANKSIINLGIAPDTGTGDSARRGGEKINNLFVDTYTLMGDNALVLDNTATDYGLRSTFAANSYMVGELHPAGRWQRVVGQDGTADDRSDGSNPNIFYASRGEQLNINLADIDLTDSDSNRAGSLDPREGNGRFQVILPLARAGDVIRIRDMDGTWGLPSGSGFNRAKGIDVWTTPFNYRGTGTWDQAGVSARHTWINNGSVNTNHSRFAVDSDNGNTVINENTAGLPFTTQYSDLEFVYTGAANGWVASGANTTLDPSTSDNATVSFNDDSDWQATGTDSDPTYTFVYKEAAHQKLNPVVQLGEAKKNSSGDIISYSVLITAIDIAAIDHVIARRPTSSGNITIIAGDIIVAVDENNRFEGRVIAAQGV